MAERPLELVSLDIPCDRHAPALVRGALAEFEDDDLSLADGMLVASELVTNAVLHSGCTADHMVSVRARLRRDRLLISVHDPGISGESAEPRRSERPELGGLGLRVVEQLAQRWGSERPDGYRVWAELAVRR
jgi:anti-sigma regulatory factor (Ser/Thr protein kinase)